MVAQNTGAQPALINDLIGPFSEDDDEEEEENQKESGLGSSQSLCSKVGGTARERVYYKKSFNRY